MVSQIPSGQSKGKSYSNKLVIDFVLWIGSISVSAIPYLLNQIHPIEELAKLTYIDRLKADIGITYSFITGITVLTIQLLLIEGENELVRERFRKPVLGILVFLDILVIAFYAHVSTMKYSEVEEFFKNQLVKGGVKEANFMVDITIVVISIILIVFHSLPPNVIKSVISIIKQRLSRIVDFFSKSGDAQ